MTPKMDPTSAMDRAFLFDLEICHDGAECPTGGRRGTQCSMTRKQGERTVVRCLREMTPRQLPAAAEVADQVPTMAPRATAADGGGTLAV